METINNISFLNYGLHISNYKGVANLQEAKEQFYTIFGKAGYQITKRNADFVDVHGYLLASSLADFRSKVTALQNLFTASGVKVINLGNGAMNTFAKDGFTIKNVHITGNVFAKFHIKLTIVS